MQKNSIDLVLGKINLNGHHSNIQPIEAVISECGKTMKVKGKLLNIKIHGFENKISAIQILRDDVDDSYVPYALLETEIGPRAFKLQRKIHISDFLPEEVVQAA